jgi:hypothetical protein
VLVRLLKSPFPWVFTLLFSIALTVPRVLNRRHYVSPHLNVRVAAAIAGFLFTVLIVRVLVLVVQLIANLVAGRPPPTHGDHRRR